MAIPKTFEAPARSPGSPVKDASGNRQPRRFAPFFPAVERHRQLSRYLEQHLPSALDLLELMVGINSFTFNPPGVNELGRMTAAAFQPLDFEPEFVPAGSDRFGNHLFLTRPGTSGRAIALVSHLDTVFPPEEEARNDFRWRPEGSRIYGPGTVDIKGGTVMIHLILSALSHVAPEVFRSITWCVMLNAAEEDLSPNFSAACEERLGESPLACLVFEGGNFDGDAPTLVTARKGRAVLRLSVEGRGAHAGSRHRQGANAVVQAAHVITRIAALTDYSRELTFNVGTVHGGSVVNRVPHHAEAAIEMRAFSPEAYRSGLDAALAFDGATDVRSAADGHECKVRVELLEETVPWPENEGTQHLLALWQEAGNECGVRVAAEHRGGLSDGNYLWETLPTIDGLGPAGDFAHCSERSADGTKLPEYVDVSSFVPKAALNALAILRLIERG